MSDDGAVVVVGGTRAIGLELARHYAGQGREVVLTGRSPGTWPPPWPSIGGSVRGVDLRPRRAAHDRARPGRRRPGGPLALVAIDRDQNTIADYDIDRAIRLVTLKLVGYTEVVYALRDGCRRQRRSSCSAAWPRSGRTRARRRSRPSTAASSG